MLVEDDEPVEIEKILSHRLIGNSWKYRIQLKNSNDMEWVCSDYLISCQRGLLEAYNKEHNIINEVRKVIETETPNVTAKTECVVEDTSTIHSGSLGLIFAEQFEIKIEFGLNLQDGSYLEDNSHVLHDVQFGAAEYMSNDITHRAPDTANIQIKLENVDPPFDEIDTQMLCLNSINHNTENITNSHSVHSIYEPVDDPDDTMDASDVMPTLDIANTIQDNITNIISLQDTNVAMETQENLEPSTSVIVPDIENDTVNGKTTENTLSKKNITIGKLKKATKPITETKTTTEQKTVRSLLLPSQISNTQDPIDEIFYNLPVVTSIIPPTPEPKHDNQSRLTFQILSSIVTSNKLDELREYSLGRHKSTIRPLLLDYPSFLISAVSNKFISMVSALLELGANVNGIDSNGNSPLIEACSNEHETIIDLLINNGAWLNVQVGGKNQLLSKLLLNAGVDFSSLEYMIADSKSQAAKCLDEHNKSLLKSIKENILVQLGPHVKSYTMIFSPRVLSLFEMQDSQVEVTFQSSISPIIENRCNLLFLITGLLHGSSMKLLISDANKITSVSLNDRKQNSLIDGSYCSVTSFTPLKDESNKLVVQFENEKCRKIRLVLVAYNVVLQD